MHMEESGFGDLLEQAEQLTAILDGSGELPRVERNLKQLCEAGRQLWTKSAQAGGLGIESSDVKASVLLGSKGLTLPKITSKLESLSATKALDPLEPLVETNVEGFLRNERENIILSLIEESRTTAYNLESKIYWDNVENDWEQQKQKVLNSFIGSSHDMAEIKLNLETRVNEPSNVRIRSAMDNVEVAYAKQVTDYNKQVIQGGIKPSLVDKFIAVASTLDDKNVIDMWAMVKCMTNAPVKVGEDLLAARVSLTFQNAFVNQARSYLEETYVKYMKATVFGNLQQASLGGVPSIINLVSSFLNLKFSSQVVGLEDGKVGKDGKEQPVWAMIYYCLRSGDLASALKVAKSAGTSLGEFSTYLAEYSHDGARCLRPRSENLFRILYKRTGQTCTDPFKKAVYCVIGCCDIKEDHSEVANKIDDYLWLKLSQIRNPPSGNDSNIQTDYLTFSQFQTKLLEEYGESYFRGYQQPFLYLQILILTAQFEAAIEFLSRIDRLRCHAVHIALVFYETKLLALPHSIHAQLISKDPADLSPMRRLNFIRLITLYTRKFEATDPREALQYFYFLRNLKGVRNENLFMSCISTLVLETKEFNTLLGCLQPDGCRTPGAIDQFEGDTLCVVEAVANCCEEKGLMEDAIRLYDLALKQDKVLELCVLLLSRDASQPNLPLSRRDRIQKMATSIAERYKSQGHLGSSSVSATFYLLLDVMTFFDTYHANKYQDALDIIKKLKLVPFQPEEIDYCVSSFRDLSDDIRRCMPDILLAAMTCLHNLFKTSKDAGKPTITSPIGNNYEGKERYLEYLQKQAHTLITFGGMVPYRMPGDTMVRLVQIQSLMY